MSEMNPQPQGTEQTPPPGGPVPPQQSPPPGMEWRPVATPDPRRRSPVVACLLSIVPGVGQIYVGYYIRGFVHIAIVASVITMLADGSLNDLHPLLGIFLPFFWLFNIIDAGRRASLYNQALDGYSGTGLPENFRMPGGEGSSLVLGGLLMLLGTVLLLNTQFDVSLDWLEDWWPLVLIGFGGYLVVKGRSEPTGGSGGGGSPM